MEKESTMSYAVFKDGDRIKGMPEITRTTLA
jgi:hypothetical protein